MDIVERNFMRLLRSGTFGCHEAIEPMSEWKWDRLYKLSLMHGVAALVYDGIRARHGEFYLNIGERQMAKWQKTAEGIEDSSRAVNEKTAELMSIFGNAHLRPVLMRGQALASLYPNPLHRTGGDCDIYFPYGPQGSKADEWARKNGQDTISPERYSLQYEWEGMMVGNHRRVQRLTNVLLNRKLQAIVEKEIRCCDSTYIYIGEVKIETLPPTLNILEAIVRIARSILNDGVRLRQIVDLGMMLRKIGDKVDFVKLQKWISSLKLTDMAQLEGALLKQLLYFEESEIQFMNPKKSDNISKILDDLFKLRGRQNDEWYFTQGKSIFVRSNNSGAMFWHLNHSRKFFRYYPSESVTNFFSSFAHSLSHIEE